MMTNLIIRRFTVGSYGINGYLVADPETSIGVFIDPGGFSAEIEATIGPCRHLDSTFTVNAADDMKYLVGNTTLPGPKWVSPSDKNVGLPNSRLFDVADTFTNVFSAWAIPATPNTTTAINKVVTIFIVPSPKKNYFQTTVSQRRQRLTASLIALPLHRI